MVAYFRDIEDNGVRGDANEGTGLFHPEGGIRGMNHTQGRSFTLPSHAFTSTARCDEIFVFFPEVAEGLDGRGGHDAAPSTRLQRATSPASSANSRNCPGAPTTW